MTSHRRLVNYFLKYLKSYLAIPQEQKARQQKMDSGSQTYVICDYTLKYTRVCLSLEKKTEK